MHGNVIKRSSNGVVNNSTSGLAIEPVRNLAHEGRHVTLFIEESFKPTNNVVRIARYENEPCRVGACCRKKKWKNGARLAAGIDCESEHKRVGLARDNQSSKQVPIRP